MKHQSFNTRNLFAFPTIFMLLLSCNNADHTTNQLDSTVEQKVETPAVANACYLGVTAKDSIRLHIEITGDSVHGNLNYLMDQKDSNTGTFTGTMHGDTLLADYHFISEGMQSIRQVSFIINDSMAFAGYGEMVENGNKMRFKNPLSLTFETKNPLKLVNCLP